MTNSQIASHGPRRRAKVAVGVCAALAASLALPAAANAAATAAPTRTSRVPAPTKSQYVAGYEQLGCGRHAFPQYVQITGTIVVPTANDVKGTAGFSSDEIDLGGIVSGVVAGVQVENSGGTASYSTFVQWGYGAPVPGLAVVPGEKVQVTIKNEGAVGYLVRVDAGGNVGSATNSDTNASPCIAGAFEQSDFPTYDHLTKTSPVIFDASRVWWRERGQSRSRASKLLATPPAHAKLIRYNLVNSHGKAIAAASAPTDHDANFKVTDK